MHPDPPRQMRLGDGRLLAWSEYGAPEGTPLFYCHGFPASRLEGELLHDEALRQGIRVISVDRPGFGASDHRPGRRLLEWPDDLAALAERLGLERFALLGLSGGAPYALAAYHRLGSRINAVALVGGLGPLDRGSLLEEMSWIARGSFRLACSHPRLLRLTHGKLLVPLLRRRPGLGLTLLSVDAPEADRRALADPNVRRILTGSMREAFRPGSRGALRELEIYAAPWGFDPGGIALPIRLWHGLADATVPVSHGRWLAARLPDCRPVFLAEEGHFSLPVRHAGRILRELRDRGGAG